MLRVVLHNLPIYKKLDYADAEILTYLPGLPASDPGAYVMNFTITDNLSGKKIAITKDIVIEEEKDDEGSESIITTNAKAMNITT